MAGYSCASMPDLGRKTSVVPKDTICDLGPRSAVTNHCAASFSNGDTRNPLGPSFGRAEMKAGFPLEAAGGAPAKHDAEIRIPAFRKDGHGLLETVNLTIALTRERAVGKHHIVTGLRRVDSGLDGGSIPHSIWGDIPSSGHGC